MAGTITFEWGFSDINLASIIFIFFMGLLAGYFLAWLMEKSKND
tara:strand:- start:334 stop:465 length:132 start_codon:yes stop_codon:yes gene_type:complete